MYKKAIVVALSGGVDSSTAAWLLKKELEADAGEGETRNDDVFIAGAMHYIWRDSRCCNAEMVLKARAVCERLGIPFYLLDLTAEFRSLVVDDFVATYKEGKTPNPCVRCNERVRFSAFYDTLKSELSRTDPVTGRPGIGSDVPLYLATGHYARLTIEDGTPAIRKAEDGEKDQSYMLYRLPARILPFLRFPLGDYRKKEVIELARTAGFLDQSVVRESQDACFVDGSYADFLREYDNGGINPGPGNITDRAGNMLGRHKGYIEYTVGQRKGLNLGTGPWYVVDIVPEHNHVIVAREEEAKTASFTVKECVWHAASDKAAQDIGFSCSVKIRYRSGDIGCRIIPGEDLSARIQLETPAIVTPGQSAVFYRGDCVLGGGIIVGSRSIS